jgi:hypothetical protein
MDVDAGAYTDINCAEIGVRQAILSQRLFWCTPKKMLCNLMPSAWVVLDRSF